MDNRTCITPPPSPDAGTRKLQAYLNKFLQQVDAITRPFDSFQPAIAAVGQENYDRSPMFYIAFSLHLLVNAIRASLEKSPATTVTERARLARELSETFMLIITETFCRYDPAQPRPMHVEWL